MQNNKLKKYGLILLAILLVLGISWISYKSFVFQYSVAPSNKTMTSIGPDITINFNMDINKSTIKIEYDESIFHQLDVSDKSIKLSTLNRETDETSTTIKVVYIENEDRSQTISEKNIDITITEFDVNSISKSQEEGLINNQDKQHERDPIYNVLPKETLDYTINAQESAGKTIVTIYVITASVDTQEDIQNKRNSALEFLKELKESDGIDIDNYFIKYEN